MATYILLAAAVVFFIFLSIKNLKYGLILLITFTPFYTIILWLMGFRIYAKFWHNGLILLMLLSVFFKLTVSRKYELIKFNILDKLFIVILFYGIFEMVNTFYRIPLLFTGVNGFRNYYFGVLVYFVTRFYMRRKEDMKPIFSAITVIMLIVSVLLILEVLVVNSKIIPNPLPWITASNEVGITYWNEGLFVHFGGATFTKPFGVMNIQNTAVFLGSGALVFIFLYLKKYKENKLNIKWQIIFYLLVISMFLTLTRTVIFAFLICLMMMHYKFRLFKVKLIVPAILLLLGVDIIGNYNLLKYIFYIPFSMTETYYATFQPSHYEASIIPHFIGYGFDVGLYEQVMLGLDPESVITKAIFPFGAEMRILNLFNQVGVIGGGLFVLQNVISYNVGIVTARKEDNKFYKNILLGLSFSIPLIFISTFHYLPIINPAIQIYYYIVMGIISSFSNFQVKGELPNENPAY